MRKIRAVVLAALAAPLMAACTAPLHPTIEQCDPSDRNMSFALKKACMDQGLFAVRADRQEARLGSLKDRGRQLSAEESHLRTDVRSTASVKDDLKKQESSLRRSLRKLKNSISAEDRSRADVQKKLREIQGLENDAAAISPKSQAEIRMKQQKLEQLERKQKELEAILAR